MNSASILFSKEDGRGQSINFLFSSIDIQSRRFSNYRAHIQKEVISDLKRKISFWKKDVRFVNIEYTYFCLEASFSQKRYGSI
jgi:hypothetical protein